MIPCKQEIQQVVRGESNYRYSGLSNVCSSTQPTNSVLEHRMQHDQKRSDAHKLSPEQQRAEAERITKYQAVVTKCNTLRQEITTCSRADLVVVQKLLEANPDYYTMYNLRRDVLTHIWEVEAKAEEEARAAAASSAPMNPTGNSSESNAGALAPRAEGEEAVQQSQTEEGGSTSTEKVTSEATGGAEQKQKEAQPTAADLKKQDLMAELQFSTKVVQKEYKSYCSWVHRKWILSLLDHKTRVAVLTKELQTCDMLLKKDERNFHAWGYRRWVTQQLAAAGLYTDEAELKFTSTKIGQNFSNYSAWHNRGLIYDQQRNSGSCVESELFAELELVSKAVFCDPADQSAWIFGIWLVTHCFAGEAQEKAKATLLSNAVELLELEEQDLKWPLLAIMRLSLDADQRASTYGKLEALDPHRTSYYKTLL